MKYNFTEIRVPHWVLENIEMINNPYVDTEYYPRYELYPNKEDKFIFKLLMRWTFRIFSDEIQIFGYISEHDFFIDYKKTEDNKEDNLITLRNLFGTSQLNNSLEFDKLKIGTILEVLTMPGFLIKDQILQEVIDSIEEHIRQQ